MMELQGELQQDIKTYLVTLQRNHDQMSTELTQSTQTTKTLCTAVQDFQTETEQKCQTLEKQLVGLQVREQSSSPLPSAADSSATLETGPSPLPPPVVKIDHLKLTFPSFGSQMMLTHCYISHDVRTSWRYILLMMLTSWPPFALSYMALPETGGKWHDHL